MFCVSLQSTNWPCWAVQPRHLLLQSMPQFLYGLAYKARGSVWHFHTYHFPHYLLWVPKPALASFLFPRGHHLLFAFVSVFLCMYSISLSSFLPSLKNCLFLPSSFQFHDLWSHNVNTHKPHHTSVSHVREKHGICLSESDLLHLTQFHFITFP